MSSERERSAIDAIYDILNKLESIEKKLTVIDNNIKLLNNKVNKLSTDSARKVAAPRAVVPSAATVKPQLSEELIKNVKVFGRIKNKQKKAIKGVDVKIYSREGKIIKSRTTDKGGYWEARIPPGEYGIEYDPSNINKRLRPVNFKVTVKKGIKELDISETNKL
jgi:hypothetical protein